VRLPDLPYITPILSGLCARPNITLSALKSGEVFDVSDMAAYGKQLYCLERKLNCADITIALLRRPTLGPAVKGTGLRERHFPRDLQPAFYIAMTKSQDEIRRLVILKDPRIWPLYGKRIIEWNEAQARAVARQLLNGIGCSEDDDPVSAVYRDNSSVSAPEVKPAPIHEPPQQRALFEKSLVAIRHIVGDLEEISSKRLVDELARIEGGPWAQWGKGRHRKPITQNALARLLKPHKIFPVDVGPEHARRKGYKRAQFERLFQAFAPSTSSRQPCKRAEGRGNAHA
jgi:hypothetical protein